MNVTPKTTSSLEISATLPDMSEYGEHLQIQTCQIVCSPEGGDYTNVNIVPITKDNSNSLSVTVNNLKSGGKYDTQVTVIFTSGDEKRTETESPVEIPLPGTWMLPLYSLISNLLRHPILLLYASN